MNIVAIRPAALGDNLLIFPILTALRAKYAHPHITFVGHPAVLPLAKSWGIAEEVVHPAHVQWHELLSPAGIRSSDLCNLLLRSDLVICWLNDSDGWVKQNLLAVGVKQFIIAPETEPINPSKHIIEYLAQPLGLQDIGARFEIPTKGWSDGFCLDNPPIAIHPGCSEEGRRWPAASFAAVIKQLWRLQYPVLLLAGPSETEVLKEVRMHLSTPPQVGMLTVLQNAPLLEVARNLKQCRSFLGNDSGISHLAGMLGIPTLVLFGPSDPIVKHPIGPAVETIQEQPLKRLPVDRVIKSLLHRSANTYKNHP